MSPSSSVHIRVSVCIDNTGFAYVLENSKGIDNVDSAYMHSVFLTGTLEISSRLKVAVTSFATSKRPSYYIFANLR